MKQTNQLKMFKTTLGCGAVILLAVGQLAPLNAASLTWGPAGAGGTGTWDANTTTNWFDGGMDVVWPAAPGSGNDDAVFDATAGTVTIAPGGVIANDLTFNVGGYLIQGDALTLDAALTKPILLTAPATTTTISAVIAGTNGFNKYDTGTLILTGSNTFYGNVQLGIPDFGGPASGVLRITQAAALGVRGNVVQPDGSTNQLIVIRADGTRLELDGSGGDITIPDHVTFVTSGPNGVVRNVAGSNTISGEMVLTTGVGDSGYISDGGSLTLAGPIHVGSSARNLILMGTNSAVNTVSGVISNAANGALTGVVKKSANSWNIWQLSGSNTYGGQTILGVNTGAAPYVTNGILRLANSSAIGTSNLVVNGGYEAGRVELTGDITITNAISLYGRQGVGYPAISSYSGSNTLTGDISVTANGATLSFESQAGLLTISGNPMTGAAGRSLTLLGAGNGIFAKPVTTNVASEIRKFGNGTWTLTASNNFTNTTITASGGRFVAAHPHAFGPAGKAMSFAASSTFELATDTPVNAWQLWTSSGSLATPNVANLVGNRATDGAALTQAFSSMALGSHSRVNFTKGNKVTAGNPVFNFTAATLSGGVGGNIALNPTTAQVNIAGAVTASGAANPKTLFLEGDNTVAGHTLGGAITDGTATPLSLVKSGASTWTLGGASSYTGATTISNGILRVTGAITNSAVTVAGGRLSGTGHLGGAVAVTGGTLEPGISTNLNEVLTINNDLTLAGTALVQIGKSGLTPVNDSVAGVTNITYGGTLIVTNATGATIAGGDAFVLFTASGTKSGNFTNIVVQPPVSGLTNTFDPATGTLTFTSTVVPQPTLNYTNTGGSLSFSWTGSFKLQSQTNALNTGLGTNWSDYPGGGTSPVSVPVSTANPSVFFRLSQ